MSHLIPSRFNARRHPFTTVEELAALAAVSPTLLNLYREGQGVITLDHLLALLSPSMPRARAQSFAG